MLKFSNLWENHPKIKGDTPLLDTNIYENQCAINMAACLIRSGIEIKNYKGMISWEKNQTNYPIRAQELADWLAQSPSPIKSRIEKYKGSNFLEHDGIRGKTGIVFFRNYWGLGLQGDHIDLWDGSRMTDKMSIVRLHVRWGSFGIGSDYRQAESVWFWMIL
jgi:hypothetical protein